MSVRVKVFSRGLGVDAGAGVVGGSDDVDDGGVGGGVTGDGVSECICKKHHCQKFQKLSEIGTTWINSYLRIPEFE